MHTYDRFTAEEATSDGFEGSPHASAAALRGPTQARRVVLAVEGETGRAVEPTWLGCAEGTR